MTNLHSGTGQRYTTMVMNSFFKFEDFISGGYIPMAHKKIERKKELDRRRKRRKERLKQRVREAKGATEK